MIVIEKVREERSDCIGDPECESEITEAYVAGPEEEVMDAITSMMEGQDYQYGVSSSKIATFHDSEYEELIKLGERLVEIGKALKHRFEGPFDDTVFDANLTAGMQMLEAC